MPKPPGADPRQSLTHFTPEGIDALACIGLALLDSINAGHLIAGNRIDAAQAYRTRMMINATYPVQDALHGASGNLPEALAAFLSTVEGG